MYIADDLYARGVETMLVFWASYADGAGGAAVHCLPGITTAVFPLPPEGELYNNALLERDLSGPERADAIDAMEASYATAGIVRFAAWVHEQDRAMCDDLERRGYVVDTSTRAMAMVLDGARLPDVDIDRPDPCDVGSGGVGRSQRRDSPRREGRGRRPGAGPAGPPVTGSSRPRVGVRTAPQRPGDGPVAVGGGADRVGGHPLQRGRSRAAAGMPEARAPVRDPGAAGAGHARGHRELSPRVPSFG
jgi:hypothetical protein